MFAAPQVYPTSESQCVNITVQYKGTSVFLWFQCETLYSVAVNAVCKHYALFVVNYALCTIHPLVLVRV